MKFARIIALLMVFQGCSSGPQKTELDTLNGYWEIEMVHFPDGSKKEFQLNSTIDYFEIKGMTGSRRKVRPSLEGTFETANEAEYFGVSQENDHLIMEYTNRFSNWKEVITNISSNHFSVVNENQITYHYKRYKAHQLQP